MQRNAVAAWIVMTVITIPSAVGGMLVDHAGIASEGGNDRKRVSLPEEDPNFLSLVDALTERAALYRKFALGFTCRENVTTAKYDIDSGNFRKSDKIAYDYLFEEKPGGGLREVREEVVEKKGGEKTKTTDFEPQAP